MKISKLQKYILKYAYSVKAKRLSRRGFEKYYTATQKPPKKADIQNIITKSLERLIDKEMLTGYGRRTPHKWFIDEISLTIRGRKEARKLFGQQQILPFIINKRRNKK